MSDTRILIVEDYTLIRDLLRTQINESGGFRVVAEAGTVAEAIAACREHRPDMMVLDWMLPDGTGHEIVQMVRSELPGMKIVMLTANEHEGVVRDAASVGVQGFVSKRQSLHILKDALQAVEAGKCFYCPISMRMLLDAIQPDGSSQQPPVRLTPRERLILRALASGMSTKEMAHKYELSPKTIANYMTMLKDKLRIQEPAGLVRYAIKNGIVDTP